MEVPDNTLSTEPPRRRRASRFVIPDATVSGCLALAPQAPFRLAYVNGVAESRLERATVAAATLCLATGGRHPTQERSVLTCTRCFATCVLNLRLPPEYCP